MSDDRSPEERARAARERAELRAARRRDPDGSAAATGDVPAIYDDDEDGAAPPAAAPPPLPADPANGSWRLDQDDDDHDDDDDHADEPPPVAPRPVAAGRPIAPRRGRRSVSGRARQAPRPARTRRAGRRIVVLLAFVALAAALYAINATFQPFKSADGGPGVAVTIPEGADAARIGEILAAKGIIDSARFFEINATVTFRRDDLRPGDYVLPRGMSNGDALEALMQGPAARIVKTFDVNIPEGLSRREAAAHLDGSGVRGNYVRASGSQEAVRAAHKLGLPRASENPEGFLFPATYELPVGAGAKRLVGLQLQAFADRRDQVDWAYARRRNLTRYDVVTIASLIEREAAPKEYRLVSAVIYNRLREGMALGIDATIRYVERNWTRPLRVSELERDTPYNTRLHTGLPPTPIGSPGLGALKAAANPAKVNYLFYVVKPGACNEHNFARTNAEHDANVAAYERARAENGGKSPTTC